MPPVTWYDHASHSRRSAVGDRVRRAITAHLCNVHGGGPPRPVPLPRSWRARAPARAVGTPKRKCSRVAVAMGDGLRAMGIKNAPGILLRHYSGMESQAAVHMLSLWKAGYERRAIIPWSLSVAYLVLDFSVIVIRMALAMQGASVGSDPRRQQSASLPSQPGPGETARPAQTPHLTSST